MQLDETQGPIEIFAQQGLTDRGFFVHIGGDATFFRISYFGTSAAYVEAPLDGAVVAPNADLVLGTDGSTAFVGEYFGSNLEVRPDTVITHGPFQCSGQVVVAGGL